MGLKEILKEELTKLGKCTLNFNLTKKQIDSMIDLYLESLEAMVEEEKYYREYFKRARRRFDKFPSCAELYRFLNEDGNRLLRKENYEQR